MVDTILFYSLSGGAISWLYRNFLDGKFAQWSNEYSRSQEDPWVRLPMLGLCKLFSCSFCCAFHVGWITSLWFGYYFPIAILFGFAAGYLAEIIETLLKQLSLFITIFSSK